VSMTYLAEKPWLAWLTLVSAVSISGVSAFFSVDGIIALFSATPWKAGIMAVVLEIGKIVAALWLHHNFGIKGHFLLKTYLVIAVVILMGLTSMGIFGTLSKSFMEHTGQSAGTYTDLGLIDIQIKDLEDNRVNRVKQVENLDKYIDVYLKSDDIETARIGVRLSSRQKRERANLKAEIDSIQKEIADLKKKKAELTKDVSKIETEVGPVIYVAELIYGEKSQEVVSKAVRAVILVIVICFDPLAILLLIAAQVSFGQLTRKEPESVVEDVTIVEQTAQPAQLEPEPIHTEPETIESSNKLEAPLTVSGVELQAEAVKQAHDPILSKLRKKLENKVNRLERNRKG